MVTSQKVNHVGVLDLISHQKAHCLDALLATINEVAYQQILIEWRWSTGNVEQPEHIIVLSMEVTSDFDGSFQFE